MSEDTIKTTKHDSATKAQDVSTKRTTIKTLAIGGAAASVALPASWQKPVVEGVLLPSHAATTGGGGDGTGGTTPAPAPTTAAPTTTPEPLNGDFFDDVDAINGGTGMILPSDQELIAQSESSPLDWIIRQAQANGSTTHICISVTNNQFEARFDNRLSPSYYTLSGTVGDPLAPMIDECLVVPDIDTIDKSIPAPQLAVNGPGAGGTLDITMQGNVTVNKDIAPGECGFKFFCGNSPK